MWVNQLKIAIVQKDMKLLDSLLSDIPQFNNAKDIETAQYLLREATNLVVSLKNETGKTMIQVKKNIDFLNSTQTHKSTKLDIIS